MSVSEIYKIFITNQLISTDSRNIIPNSLFFALKGNNFDGNIYALDAIAKGASYSIVDDIQYASNNRCIVVKDVLTTLQDLANYHRKQLNIPVIGITGSNGKTTTKELLLSVLSSQYNAIATKGNLNNHIGVPLSLLSINKDHELAIIEMGANHIGEIDELCRIAEPNYGLITNIGKAHLEGFGSLEGVIKAKTELYRFLDKNNGNIFINADNNILVEQSNALTCKKIYYGNASISGIKGEVLQNEPYLSIALKNQDGSITRINSQLTGNYNSENIIAAVCIGNYFNIAISKISESVSGYTPSNSRSQIVETSKNTLICDYYNANPSSMEIALKNFLNGKYNGRKKVVMLGAMKELGVYSVEEHQKIVDLTATMNFSDVFFVGEEFLECKNAAFKFFNSSEDLGKYLALNPTKDVAILIKGSRGSKMEKIVEYL